MRSGLFRISLTLVATALASTAIAFADTAPGIETTPIPNNAKPDWSSMSFMVGTWQCTSQSSRRASPAKSTQTNTMDSTGYWMVQKTIQPKLSWASAVSSVDMITYDKDQKRWVDVYTDDGGNYDVSFSPGWKGNTIVWTDAIFVPGPDIIATSPLTTVKVSDSKVTFSSSFTEKSGRKNTLTGYCTKS
ncbi:MAG: hypothetical protein JO347_04295 [Candidatus Eremiobacteraeota bacterium]|nr:hypothetical protein [Candidatus Eremiobacteraeota bacterium]